MAVLTTKKELDRNFFCVYTGNVKHLLRYQNPVFYTKGTYGINFHGYLVACGDEEICLINGSRRTFSNCKNNFSSYLSALFEARAEAILGTNIVNCLKKDLIKDLLQLYIKCLRTDEVVYTVCIDNDVIEYKSTSFNKVFVRYREAMKTYASGYLMAENTILQAFKTKGNE